MSLDFARRRFLYGSLTGLGGIALADLMRADTIASSPLAPKTPHHKPKAKSCIFLSMLGGVSQMDSFDPKPALEKFDNTVMDWSKEKNTDQANLFAKPRLILRSAFSVVTPYLTSVPLYGGLWMMACASATLDPASVSATEIDSRIAARGIAHLQYYNGDMHRAALALPNFVRNLVR